MRLLGLVHSRERHLKEGSWTGADASAKQFFSHLEKHGHKVMVKGCKLSKSETYLSGLWSLQHQRTDRLFITENVFARHLKTQRATKYVEQYADDIDLVVVNSTLFEPFVETPTKPYVVHTDYNYHLRYSHPHYQPKTVWSNNSQKQIILNSEKALYHHALHTFVPSEYIRQSLINFYEVPADKVSVVGRGIPSALPEHLPERDFRQKRFLFIGEPKSFDRKGGEDLVAAFARVRKTYPHATLTMVGPSPEMIGTHKGITALGTVDRQALHQVFEDHTCFVFPTRQEPFGLVIAEAMAYGLPVVTTTVDGISELVLDGETGVLIPPCNDADLTEAMLKICDNPKKAEEMGKVGHERIRAHFTWAHVTACVNQTLNGLQM